MEILKQLNFLEALNRLNLLKPICLYLEQRDIIIFRLINRLCDELFKNEWCRMNTLTITNIRIRNKHLKYFNYVSDLDITKCFYIDYKSLKYLKNIKKIKLSECKIKDKNFKALRDNNIQCIDISSCVSHFLYAVKFYHALKY